MKVSELRNFDLNSLVVLKVLLETQHVTETADRLNLTQSAVSRTLGKLRRSLNDPLLVKSGRGLTISKTAESMLPRLNDILEGISEILVSRDFEPEQFDGEIRLATTDYGTYNLLPKLAPLLAESAPGMRLTTMDWRSDALTELEDNSVDLMIGSAPDLASNIHQRVVAQDSFRCVVRKGVVSPRSITIDEYASIHHIAISSLGRERTQIDRMLAQMGIKRRVAVTVPHYFAALEIVATTSYMILLPSRFISRYVDQQKFDVFEPPFETPVIEISMFWNSRTHYEPANKWFREFVYEKLYAGKDYAMDLRR